MAVGRCSQHGVLAHGDVDVAEAGFLYKIRRRLSALSRTVPSRRQQR